MRLITCVGSKSSGKTCLLNILQEKAPDGKAFSFEEQDEVFSIRQEFNHKPQKLPMQANGDTNINSRRKSSSFEYFKKSNKIVPKIVDSCNNSEVDKVENDSYIPTIIDSPDSKPCDYSELLGKTAPTIGVNHFEFIVDDLTLQVAGKYWKRKGSEKNKIYSSIACCSSNLNGKRQDGIELRELGGEIGKFLRRIRKFSLIRKYY